jgi:hypothetical protein
MKSLVTVFALLLITITFAQSTAYHSDDKLGKKNILGKWFISGVKQDMLIMQPNTVAYAKVYREVKKALDFYGLKFEEPLKDESVISSLCKSFDDFETMDLTIKISSSEIDMTWKSDLVIITWICNVDSYGMAITEL